MTVNRGEVLGFLGPNGAGKSTTMKILTCFTAPTEGSAKVAGHDVLTDSLAARTAVGYLPESNPLYHDMLVLEYLKFIASVRGLSSASFPISVRSRSQASASMSCGKPGGRISPWSPGRRTRRRPGSAAA